MCWPAEAVQALQLAHAQAVATAAADKARREWMSAWPAIQDLGKRVAVKTALCSWHSGAYVFTVMFSKRLWGVLGWRSIVCVCF